MGGLYLRKKISYTVVVWFLKLIILGRTSPATLYYGYRHGTLSSGVYFFKYFSTLFIILLGLAYSKTRY